MKGQGEKKRQARNERNLTTNDPPFPFASLRSLGIMSKLLKDASLKGTVLGHACDTVGDAVEFAKSLGVVEESDERMLVYGEHKDCVVKPRRGVASEGVFKCGTLQDVAEASGAVIGSRQFGDEDINVDCLVQEYVEGVEIAVDTVSRNGETKVSETFLWTE